MEKQQLPLDLRILLWKKDSLEDFNTTELVNGNFCYCFFVELIYFFVELKNVINLLQNV